jgi:hypothetical protein
MLSWLVHSVQVSEVTRAVTSKGGVCCWELDGEEEYEAGVDASRKRSRGRVLHTIPTFPPAKRRAQVDPTNSHQDAVPRSQQQHFVHAD